MPVILLCHADGTNGSTTFADTAGSHTLTPTACTVSTTTPKFGTGSADFTAGSTAAITVSTRADFLIGNSQFTAEAWAYFTSAPGSTTLGVLTLWGGAGQLSWFLGMLGGALAFYYSTTGSDNPSVGAAYTPPTNTWIHIAADRNASNVLRVYANGVVIASATVSATFNAPLTGACVIGNDGSGVGRHFLGRLDDIRFTMGQAQYGGAFTPPTAPFSDPIIAHNAPIVTMIG